MTEAHRKLLRIQKRIFRSLVREAERLFGEKPEAIRAYEAEYQRDFRGLPARLRRADKSELLGEIRSRDVTWIGDFHTFAQAQRAALRLLREAVRPGETWFVGVEMIPSQFQEQLDAFQAGKLPLKAFLSAIRYREEWGFPWEHYAPLLEWAREAGVRVIALNRPKAMLRADRDQAELAERDQWAAGVITDLLAPLKAGRVPARMVALYGELHVGSQHLPAQLRRISRAYLKKPLRSLMIHQNLDTLYWRLAERGEEIETQILRIGLGSYCVFSATPWAKLQSLVDWAEGGFVSATAGSGPSDGGDPDEDLAEAAPDHLAAARASGAAIAEFVGVEPKGFDSLHLRSIADPDLEEWLESEGEALSPLERAVIRFHVLHNQRIYIPRSRVGFLGTPSPNGIAEIAALHLLKELAGGRAVFRKGDRDDFYRQVLDACFGFFGSLVLNPKRKCDLPEDHARRIRELERGSAPAPKEAFRGELAARRLAVQAMLKDGEPRGGAFMSDRRHSAAVAIGARMAGSILGKRLHAAVVEGRVSTEDARKAFFTRVPADSGGAHEQRFARLLEATRPAKL